MVGPIFRANVRLAIVNKWESTHIMIKIKRVLHREYYKLHDYTSGFL